MAEALKRPEAHYASGRDKGLTEFRYYDVYIWDEETRSIEKYKITHGTDALAKARLTALDERRRLDLDYSPLNRVNGAGYEEIYKGFDYLNKGAKENALLQFQSVVEQHPDLSEGKLGLAETSYESRLYGDAAWAYQGVVDSGDTMSVGSWVRMGISYLVLGDYQNAYDAFDRAHAMTPLDSGIRKWRVAAAFGLGGWKRALDTLTAKPPLNPGPGFDGERPWTYNIVYAAFRDMDDRARAAGMHYPRLAHLSLIYELLTTVAESGVLHLDRQALEHERWQLWVQMMNIYRNLPLKPLPPKRAIEQEIIAERAVKQGNVKGEAFEPAVMATAIAPWWPEAHFNLAVYARDSWGTIRLNYDGETYYNLPIARQEFMFYVLLDPQGANATAACRQLKEWKVKWKEECQKK